MPVNAAAENVFGTMGAIFWTVQLIPQLHKTWRTKSTEGLSPWLVFLWGISSLPLGVYVIVQDLNIPLIVQPQLFGLFSLLSWGQCMYYGATRSRVWCAAVLGGTLALWGVLEATLVFVLRPSYRHGVPADKTGVRFLGSLGSALLAIALLPQFYEIYKHGAVLGISLTFMAIDLLGGVFSILSLVFKHRVDAIAAVAYSLVVVRLAPAWAARLKHFSLTVLDGLVLVLAMILNPRAKKRTSRRGHDRPNGGDGDGITITVITPATSVQETALSPVSTNHGGVTVRKMGVAEGDGYRDSTPWSCMAMDGLVLLLATIFNPRATRCTQHGEDRARDNGGDNGDGSMLTVTVVMPAIRDQESNKKDPGKDHPAYNGVTGY
ncbi:PQ loop repeat-domain-containing protein [Lactifluus subvellereus]|nr:PQ loop repeat-domain-containing protein [Lactifluus subvellereus]